MSEAIVYVVHCVDTEGPLNETLEATFNRVESAFGVKLDPTPANLHKLQNLEINLGGLEKAVSKFVDPELLSYNRNWDEIDSMLGEITSKEFRNKELDSYGGGWIYSWHCMDHLGVIDNPRGKDIGYGNIFSKYRDLVQSQKWSRDEVNWHFHPLSVTRKSTDAATSYLNNYDVLLHILARRIIDDGWFPTVNRPGFHSERPDSHNFLEQWIPFDYANQFCTDNDDQPDTQLGRFGDWSRSSNSWRGYNPHHDDYQAHGSCRRTIFRCLNIGTRMRKLGLEHVKEAFIEAEDYGNSILAFANHDWRDMRKDINKVREMLLNVSKSFNGVKFKFSGAEEAAIQLLPENISNQEKISLEANLEGNRLIVTVRSGKIFGPQPFLAYKTFENKYYHDNFDLLIPGLSWSYVFDEQTMNLDKIDTIGVGTAGRFGKFSVVTIKVHN